jgi:hypothetical protein
MVAIVKATRLMSTPRLARLAQTTSSLLSASLLSNILVKPSVGQSLDLDVDFMVRCGTKQKWNGQQIKGGSLVKVQRCEM